MTERLTASSLPVRASGEPQKLDIEPIKARYAVRFNWAGDTAKEELDAIGALIAEVERLRASASPSDDGARQPNWRDINKTLGECVAHRGQILKALTKVVEVTQRLLPEYLYRGNSHDRSIPLTQAYAEAKRVTEEFPLAAAASDDGAAREPGLDLEPIKANPECMASTTVSKLVAEVERQRARIVVLETSVDSLRYLIDHPATQQERK